MEILDVWKDLYGQVNAITKRQIATFPETRKPKTQRDLDVEVNVDKTIEALNNLLETRLGSLEFVLRNDAQLKRDRPEMVRDDGKVEGDVKEPEPAPPVPRYAELTSVVDRRRLEREAQERIRLERERQQRRLAETEARIRREVGEEKGVLGRDIQKSVKELPFQSAYQDVINTGSAVSLWNTIVRYYTKPGLSKTTQEMIKTKVQDLTPNLDAMTYGLGETVDVLFGNKFDSSLGMKIMEVMRTSAIYRLIKKQVETSSFELISVSAMDTAFKNLFAELSQERRELLQEVAERGTSLNRLNQRPIRLIPDFDTASFESRLKALKDELGVKDLPTDLVKSLKRMNQADFEKYADEAIRVSRSTSERKRVDPNILNRIDEINRLSNEIIQAQIFMSRDIPNLERHLNAELDHLAEPPLEDEKEVELPEGGNHPEDLNIRDYMDPDGDVGQGWLEAVALWNAKEEEALRLDEQRQQAEVHNRIVRENRDRSEAQRQERIRLITEVELPQLQQQKEKTEQVIAESEEQIERITDDLEGLRETWVDQALEALEQLRDRSGAKFQQTRGKGKPKGADVDTRGLATLRQHYGVKDETDSEEEDESEEEYDSDEEDALDFDDRRNEMYYTRPKK